MSGLVAPKAVAPTDETTDISDKGVVVKTIPFYPDITLSDLRWAMRVNGTVTTARLKHAATCAALYVNDLLKEWQAAQTAETLGDVPSTPVNDETRHLFLYRQAVYSFTKSYLIENYRDIDTTREGEKHAEALSTQIDDLRRDGQNAVRDLMGFKRMVAELA